MKITCCALGFLVLASSTAALADNNVCRAAGNSEFLMYHVDHWNQMFNRGANGKPIIPAYDRAVHLIDQGFRQTTLPLLDQAAHARGREAIASAVPVEAGIIADMIRSCPAWLPPEPGQQPAIIPKNIRRKLSASPRVLFE